MRDAHTAVIAREHERYNIDIAALNETRMSAQSQFEEVGCGYTFYCCGYPVGEPLHAGVGFAIRSQSTHCRQHLLVYLLAT